MPWQLWWVDLGNPIGHEQGGLRPVIVVSSSTHCRFPIDMALIAPLRLLLKPMRADRLSGILGAHALSAGASSAGHHRC